jgi:hypothetical protein
MKTYFDSTGHFTGPVLRKENDDLSPTRRAASDAE